MATESPNVQGSDAYYRDEPREANPYQPGGQDWKDWYGGWLDARVEDLQSCPECRGGRGDLCGPCERQLLAEADAAESN